MLNETFLTVDRTPIKASKTNKTFFVRVPLHEKLGMPIKFIKLRQKVLKILIKKKIKIYNYVTRTM